MKRNIRVLILDDDRDVCKLFFATLAKDGREILTASSAYSGLHTAALYFPDILLVDIGLRGNSDGFSFLERWSRQYDGGGAKVVIISGHGDPAYIDRARQLGAIDYLVKPISPEKLESVVASLEVQLLEKIREESSL